MNFEPGLHFAMPEAEYHRIPALSASGLKWLRVSSYDYWVRSNWNPRIADVIEEEGDTDARFIGRAFDRRIVEGRAAFDASYVPAIQLEDYPGALRTVEDLKGELRKLDEAVSGNKDVLIERLLEADPSAKIWDVMLNDYCARHAGKEFLSAKLIKKIEVAAAMIEKHPELKHAFTGGASQVSVLWRCAETNVECKARLDYLKPRAIVDLKTFANVQGKPLALAIAREIVSRRYHIQAAMYDEATLSIPEFIKSKRVFGSADPALLAALAKGDEKTFMLVFQLKGVAPVARGITLPRSGMTFQIGQREVENGKELFKACVAKYGYETPWVDVSPIEALDDAAVPNWAYD
jgi:hypothetical protein